MVKKVLIVNDIPGAGKVAGNINIPILAAAYVETAILPTLLLSTQTGGDYHNIVVRHMDDAFAQILSHWQINQINFDGYLTGYFAKPKQIEDFYSYYKKEKQNHADIKLIMDPIMGDGGDFYDGFNHTILDAFSKLIPYVDIIMPNLTEASLLSGYPYKPHFKNEDYYHMAQTIRQKGVNTVILTGVLKDNKIGFYLLNADYPQGKYILHTMYKPEMFGTGDIVVSLLTALYVHGYPIVNSLEWIGHFIEKVFELTFSLRRDRKWGLYYEPLLYQINQFMEEIIYDKKQSNI